MSFIDPFGQQKRPQGLCAACQQTGSAITEEPVERAQRPIPAALDTAPVSGHCGSQERTRGMNPLDFPAASEHQQSTAPVDCEHPSDTRGTLNFHSAVSGVPGVVASEISGVARYNNKYCAVYSQQSSSSPPTRRTLHPPAQP